MAIGWWQLVGGSWLVAIGWWQACWWQLVGGHFLLAIGWWQLVGGNWLVAAFWSNCWWRREEEEGGRGGGADPTPKTTTRHVNVGNNKQASNQAKPSQVKPASKQANKQTCKAYIMYNWYSLPSTMMTTIMFRSNFLSLNTKCATRSCLQESSCQGTWPWPLCNEIGGSWGRSTKNTGERSRAVRLVTDAKQVGFFCQKFVIPGSPTKD